MTVTDTTHTHSLSRRFCIRFFHYHRHTHRHSYSSSLPHSISLSLTRTHSLTLSHPDTSADEDRCYHLCQLPVDCIGLYLSIEVQVTSPKGNSSSVPAAAIHQSIKGPLTVLTELAYGTCNSLSMSSSLSPSLICFNFFCYTVQFYSSHIFYVVICLCYQ